MILSQEDIEVIGQLYTLGEIAEVIPLQGGLSNYNFEIKTAKGNFVARFSSFENDRKREKRLVQQIAAINFLRENNFKYAVPEPLLGRNGSYVQHVRGKPAWVYRKVEGEVKASLKEIDRQQLAQLIAEFHLVIEKMPLEAGGSGFYDYQGLKRGISKAKARLEKKKRKGKMDLLMQENLHVLERGFDRISKIDFGPERIFAHSDWFASNLVLKDDKIVGLIDFDTFEIAPRTKDVACAIQLYCFTEDNRWDDAAARNFIEQYERINRLDKLEKYHLKDHIIRESCFAAIFFYLKNKKADKDRKLFLLKWSLDSIKHLLEDIDEGEYC